RLDRLPGTVDHLLDHVRRAGQPRLDRGDITGRHVLAGVQADPVHPERQKIIQVPGEPAAHVLGSRVEVGEVLQLAVLHLVPVEVVDDVVVPVAPAVVEFLVLVDPRVVVVAVRRSGPAGTRVVLRRHVVDHGVDDDLHARAVTGVDHCLELGAGALAGLDPGGETCTVPYPAGPRKVRHSPATEPQFAPSLPFRRRSWRNLPGLEIKACRFAQERREILRAWGQMSSTLGYSGRHIACRTCPVASSTGTWARPSFVAASTTAAPTAADTAR